MQPPARTGTLRCVQLRTPTSDAERGLSAARVQTYARAVVDVRASEGVWSVVPLRLNDTREAARFPAGTKSISIVTAYNPRGVPHPEHLNVQAQQALMSRLKGGGVLRLAGLSRAADASWAEPAVGMVDVPLEQAIAVSVTCQQSAFFHWTPGILSIVWTPENNVVTADARYCRTIIRND